MFELTAPPRYRLERAPLAQALAQVRFPLVAHLGTIAGIAPLQERIKHLFPFMEAQYTHQLSFVIGPGGSATDDQQNTQWHFTSDRGDLLVVDAGSATLSAGDNYEGVEKFADIFKQVLAELADVESIRRCDRVGVRYLSLAEQPPGDDRAWTRWFRPELTGWVGSPVVQATSVRSAITQVELVSVAVPGLPPIGEAHAIVRHGVVPGSTAMPGVPPVVAKQLSYVLDFDLFVAAPHVFDVELINQEFLALHSQIDRFFRWTLSDEGEQYFGVQEVE